jgi:NAD(P)-dependent dehydrogenase (short-subunit alcohol dehydrogenase family)
MISEVERRTGGRLDAVVAGAGTIEGTENDIVSVNHFGAAATLSGLRPMLAASSNPAAVAISSNSATAMAGTPMGVVAACLAGDEATARDAVAPHVGYGYPTSKVALAHWVRRHAVRPEWIGAGIRLNAVAPGLVDTPMNEGKIEAYLSLGDVYPVPIARAGRPEEVAETIAFLLSPAASFCVGSILFVDGGSDAALRSDDWPLPPPT